MGDFYGRLMGVVKNCICKDLFKRKVSEDELTTVLAKTEIRVNNHLTNINDDVDHPTPSDTALQIFKLPQIMYLLYNNLLLGAPIISPPSPYLWYRDVEAPNSTVFSSSNNSHF